MLAERLRFPTDGRIEMLDVQEVTEDSESEDGRLGAAAV